MIIFFVMENALRIIISFFQYNVLHFWACMCACILNL